MKVRIKYSKTGVLRFIGHLDVMRFYQKAIKRAGIDISYSQGYSPHQLITFAAPLALGVTSDGEYFDAELNSATSSEDMIKQFNDVLVDGMKVTDIVELGEGAKTAMAIVSASDYMITFKEEVGYRTQLLDKFDEFTKQEEIVILKKTKRSEKEVNIKPSIYEIKLDNNGIYMLLATGSVENLKPELVIEALYNYTGIEYNKYDFNIHRIETYMRDESDALVSLLEAGRRI